MMSSVVGHVRQGGGILSVCFCRHGIASFVTYIYNTDRCYTGLVDWLNTCTQLVYMMCLNSIYIRFSRYYMHYEH